MKLNMNHKHLILSPLDRGNVGSRSVWDAPLCTPRPYKNNLHTTSSIWWKGMQSIKLSFTSSKALQECWKGRHWVRMCAAHRSSCAEPSTERGDAKILTSHSCLNTFFTMALNIFQIYICDLKRNNANQIPHCPPKDTLHSPHIGERKETHKRQSEEETSALKHRPALPQLASRRFSDVSS